MARMRVIGSSLDKGYRDDLNYNFGLLEALIGEANGLTDALRQEMLNYINNLQQQIDMLTGENIAELLERLNDSIQQALTAAQDARTAKTATEEATALATTATELANASALLAEEKANYANEKAVLAQEAADNANQETSNLSQLKIDVVQATQDANTAIGNANQATQAAQTATNSINVVLPNVEGLVNLKEWHTETQYKKNNFVTLEGNGYMALRDNKGVRPPSLPELSNADWAMFVQKGEKGEQGTGVRILGTLPDESSLPPIGELGDAYMVGEQGNLYVWQANEEIWQNVGPIKGPPGPPGRDADLTEVNEHLGHDVLSENGAHGIRYFNGELSAKNKENQWEVVETGGAEMYQNYVMREETSNALGSNTFSQSTTFASIVKSVDAANNKLTLVSPEGISVLDAVKLKRNDSVILEDATVTAISKSVITISTSSTLDATITHVFKLGGSKTNQNAEGLKTVSSGSNSHAEGLSTVAFGDNSHAEGMENYASGTASHAEGRFTRATGFASHAEGLSTKAVGYRAHAEGTYTEATGVDSHAEGQGTKANGTHSHAEGSYTKAFGECSHAEGAGTEAFGECSHAEGMFTSATGDYSHAGGDESVASGTYSFAHGVVAEAKNYASFAIGSASKMTLANATAFVATADAFVIGGGANFDVPANAFRVTFDGKAYGKAAYNSTGADYAEYFEWLDGNVNDEDRVGFVVALDGDKIRKAVADDTYILGIISANPSVIGDSHQDDWNDKYVTDEWGRIQYHWVDVKYEEIVPVTAEIEGGGFVHTTETIIKTRQDYVPMLNPNWNNDEEYIPREERKEWDAVGLMGKLLVRDDGTCEVNSYAKIGEVEGVLTASNERTDMRVIERVAPNIIRVFIK